MIRCFECDRFRLKSAEKMAEIGFGNCALGPDWEFHSAERPKECGHFTPAPAEVAKQRGDWLNKRKKRDGRD